MNETGSTENQEKVIREILRYLIRNPDAKDTLDGIIRWWRTQRRAEWGKKAVQEALDFLVSKGWLTRRMIGPSKILYGVNKERLNEIKAALRDL